MLLSLDHTTLYFENDFFASQDRYYTVGLKYSATFHTTGEKWLKLPFVDDSRKHHYITFSLGQQIYTPSNPFATELLVDDRPYAGWLYGSSAWQQMDDKTTDTVELQVGIVGPSAGGEHVINIFHDLIGNDPALGWHNQLADEPGLVVGYERKWRYTTSNMLWGTSSDVFPHAGGTIGNVHTYANGGAHIRFGWNMPNDYGSSKIRPNGEHNMRVNPNDKNAGWMFYVYAGAESRMVLRNIFLDGNTFKESHSVEKVPLVGHITAGWVLSYKKFCFSYSHTVTTKEFKTQPDAHQFASLVFSWMF